MSSALKVAMAGAILLSACGCNNQPKENAPNQQALQSPCEEQYKRIKVMEMQARHSALALERMNEDVARLTDELQRQRTESIKERERLRAEIETLMKQLAAKENK
ncbi:MAG: hypothetical protein ABFD92_05585 [Planctomycetaceae bacterium]|nr:hypothetical protein [Planctomycetaceae bacterium]